MARIAGKLTAKSLGWDRNAIGAAVKKVPQDGGRVFIGRVVGIVSGLHETVNDDTSEVQTGLKGNFRGISSLPEMRAKMDGENPVMKDGVAVMEPTGEPITMTAGRCYLPGGIQEMVEGAYKGARQGDTNATVSFGVDLYAVPATNKAGYSYDADTVTEAATADPLDALLQSANALKALPGTKADEPAKVEDKSAKTGK
jgi:hypothetical protein